uniref:Uncharacterized protein n=1 Tax=Anguilla anguilla TaxID=7936 RepID=A0A0E9UAG2_ANGAN
MSCLRLYNPLRNVQLIGQTSQRSSYFPLFPFSD